MIEKYYTKQISKNGKVSYKPVNTNEITIYGKTIDEIVDILNALEIERIYDIKMTMSNLKNLMEIYQKEQQEILREQLEKARFEIDDKATTIKIEGFKGGK